MDFNQCPCSGKSLARLLHPAVMAILAKEDLHGYIVVLRLKALTMFSDHVPDATGVYRLLKSMEKNGLVTSKWDLSENGPARRRYALTLAGRECLTTWVKTLKIYRDAVTGLIDVASAATKREGRARSSGRRWRASR